METTTQNSQGLSAGATKTVSDDESARAPNPKRNFDSPELLLADKGLSDADKLSLLQEWDSEIDNRLKAEEEGFSASDPIRSRHEAAIADEAARVKSALTEVTRRIDGSA
jgi:hypothetical protein